MVPSLFQPLKFYCIFLGKPAKPRKASLPRITPSGSTNENPPNVQAGNVYGLNAERNAQRGFPPIERAVPVQGGYAPVERTIPAGSFQNPDQVEGPIEGAQGRPLPVDRSASAGTMSAPSSLENEQGIYSTKIHLKLNFMHE